MESRTSPTGWRSKHDRDHFGAEHLGGAVHGVQGAKLRLATEQYDLDDDDILRSSLVSFVSLEDF